MNRVENTLFNLFAKAWAIFAMGMLYFGLIALASVHYFLQIFVALVVAVSISFGSGSFAPLCIGCALILIGLGIAVKDEL